VAGTSSGGLQRSLIEAADLGSVDRLWAVAKVYRTALRMIVSNDDPTFGPYHVETAREALAEAGFGDAEWIGRRIVND
jgi:hypothetical protein